MTERILSLPAELFASVMSQWLVEWKDVVHLDSAFCNRRDRIMWLEVVADNCTFHSAILKSKKQERTISWFLHRRIRVGNLNCYYFDDCNNQVASLFTLVYITGSGSTINKLGILYAPDPELFQSIEHSCFNLSELNVASCTWDSTLFNMIKNNTRLTCLRTPLNLPALLVVNIETPTVVYHANQLTLPNLTKLELDVSWFNCTLEVPTLQKLRLIGTYCLTRISFEKCQYLVHLDIRDSDILGHEFSHLMTALQNVRCLLFTDAILSIIPQRHANSLRYLNIGRTATFSGDVTFVLNNCHNLHSFYTDIVTNLSTIHNNSIQTLHLPLHDNHTIERIKTSFSNLTTLGLKCSDFHVLRRCGYDNILNVSTSVHTIEMCVWREEYYAYKFSEDFVNKLARSVRLVYMRHFDIMHYEDD